MKRGRVHRYRFARKTDRKRRARARDPGRLHGVCRRGCRRAASSGTGRTPARNADGTQRFSPEQSTAIESPFGDTPPRSGGVVPEPTKEGASPNSHPVSFGERRRWPSVGRESRMRRLQEIDPTCVRTWWIPISTPRSSYRASSRTAISKWSRRSRSSIATFISAQSGPPKSVRSERGRTNHRRKLARADGARAPRRGGLHARVPMRRDGGIQERLRGRAPGRRHRDDFAVHAFWVHHNVDGYAVADESVRAAMIARGARPERILASAFPSTLASRPRSNPVAPCANA